MIGWPVQHSSARRGLSLLELLLALLLSAVPLVAAQSLIFRTADSARFAADEMLARQAALSSYERILLFTPKACGQPVFCNLVFGE